VYEPWSACSDCGLGRSRIVWRAAKARVAEEHVFALDVMMPKNGVEKLARRSDERLPVASLLKARSLPNEGEGCMLGP
jgi:hypothetical protein